MNNKITLGVLLLVGLVTGYFISETVNKSYFSNRVKNNINIESTEESKIGYGNGMGMGMGYKNSNYSRSSCFAEGCLNVEDLNYPVGNLSQTQKDSLIKAINDEYKAYATYDAVINKFGNVRPFIMIIRSEEQHISALKSLFDKYGIKTPSNTSIGKVTAPSSLVEACNVGVQAEIANANLYKTELLPTVQDLEDVKYVFTNLMNASNNMHLPAFQRCAK